MFLFMRQSAALPILTLVGTQTLVQYISEKAAILMTGKNDFHIYFQSPFTPILKYFLPPLVAESDRETVRTRPLHRQPEDGSS
jgi:hypothetical protein